VEPVRSSDPQIGQVRQAFDAKQPLQPGRLLEGDRAQAGVPGQGEQIGFAVAVDAELVQPMGQRRDCLSWCQLCAQMPCRCGSRAQSMAAVGAVVKLRSSRLSAIR